MCEEIVGLGWRARALRLGQAQAQARGASGSPKVHEYLSSRPHSRDLGNKVVLAIRSSARNG